MSKKIKGSAVEAESWIRDSSLSEEQKEQLLKFVKRFKTLTFFKKERPDTDPAWLQELGKVLLGAVPDDLCWYKFESFDHSEYDDYRYHDSFYNEQGFSRDLGEYTEIFMDGEPLLIVACILEDLGSVLAVKGGQDGDLGVYDFNYGDIKRGENGQGVIDAGDAVLAFPSYLNMLSRIKSICLEEETVVKAEFLEGEKAKGYHIEVESCINCGSCAEECPVSCISEGQGHYVIDKNICTECGECADICTTEAIIE
jgi:NAD-dependent dihydropyrimidine dehydrogenase PreA subunit